MTLGILTDCSDETLMQRFCETLDDDIFRVIAERHYDRAIRMASALLGNSTAAGDAVQETLLRVVRQRRLYDPKRPLSPWLFTILRNVCLDIKRSEARRFGAQQEYADSLLAPYDNTAAKTRATTLLEGLSEDEVRLLEMRYVRGLSAAEAATTLGCSLEAVKKRFQRVLGRLRSEWRGCPGLP